MEALSDNAQVNIVCDSSDLLCC